jgi:serine/threonine-protein kinase
MIKKTAMLLIGAVLIVSVLTSGCTFNVGNTTTSPTSTTYTSKNGFSIAYPSDWGKPQEFNGAFVGFATPTHNESENLNVQVMNLSASDTLETVTDDVISNAQDYDNFNQIAAHNTTLAGLPAYKIVFTATTNEGDQLKALQMWTVKDDKAYIITYKGTPANYDTYLSAAQKMIDSFQIY